MCDVIGAVISAAGTIMQGMSAYKSAKAQANIARQQSEYQAQVLEQNAAQARSDAEAVSKQGMYEEGKLRDRRRKIMGAQNAAAGASGLFLASGSMTDIAADTMLQTDADIKMLQKNYQQQKFKYINEGVSLEGQAAMTRAAGANTASALKSQGKSALIGSLLTTAGTVAGKWDTIFGGSSGGSASALASGSVGTSVRTNPSLPDGWGWGKKSFTDDFLGGKAYWWM